MISNLELSDLIGEAVFELHNASECTGDSATCVCHLLDASEIINQALDGLEKKADRPMYLPKLEPKDLVDKSVDSWLIDIFLQPNDLMLESYKEFRGVFGNGNDYNATAQRLGYRQIPAVEWRKMYGYVCSIS